MSGPLLPGRVSKAHPLVKLNHDHRRAGKLVGRVSEAHPPVRPNNVRDRRDNAFIHRIT